MSEVLVERVLLLPGVRAVDPEPVEVPDELAVVLRLVLQQRERVPERVLVTGIDGRHPRIDLRSGRRERRAEGRGRC